MFNLFRTQKKDSNQGARQVEVAKEQLKKNRAVIESLRDYDEGKKDIRTADVEKRLQDLRTVV